MKTTDKYGNVVKHSETVYKYKNGGNTEKEYVTNFDITYYEEEENPAK